eukprot:6192935-Pleurochrysis_carterae.AAC.2
MPRSASVYASLTVVSRPRSERTDASQRSERTLRWEDRLPGVLREGASVRRKGDCCSMWPCRWR